MAPSRGANYGLLSRARSYLCDTCLRRGFATSPTVSSGHNRWSKIKHDKGKNDAAKNRQRSIFAQEIATASRLFGPEPTMNPRLADLVTKAKREGFAKASIESAIARGQGRSVSGAALENVTVEGMLPGNVGVIVECETDSRLRTLAGVRLAMKEAGGTATPSAFLFEKRGRITFERAEGIDLDKILEAALEAGATDVGEEDQHGGFVVFSEPENTKAVGEQIAKMLELPIATSEIIWWPNEDTKVGVSSEQVAQELGAFVDDLQEKDPSISTVAMNVARGSLSDESWRDLQNRLVA